jgi:hypothetical protein
MPSSPPILPSRRSCSHAARLPRLVVVLPLALVLCCISFLSHHHLPAVGASTVSHATASRHATLHLWCGRSLSAPAVCHVTSCHASSTSLHTAASQCAPLLPLVWLVVTVAPSPATCLAGCRVASHHAIRRRLHLLSYLILPLLSLSSVLAGRRVTSHHDGPFRLPAPLPPRNFVQAMRLILKTKCIQYQAGNYEKHLIVFHIQMESTVRWQPWS